MIQISNLYKGGVLIDSLIIQYSGDIFSGSSQ